MILCYSLHEIPRRISHAVGREDQRHRHPRLLRLIRESVEAGEYASTSEMIRDAMRLWQRRREEHAEAIKAIKARIRRSLDDPRPSLTCEEARGRLEACMDQVDKEQTDASS